LTTHYLEEADSLANRILVINKGKVIADGRPESIKEAAADRQVICRTRLSVAQLRELPGVTRVDAQGDGVRLMTTTAEATARALLTLDEAASGLEVRSAGLEEAFLALTSADDTRAVA